MKHRGLALGIAAGLALGLATRGAAAGDLVDYDPHSTAWNGMASFIGLAGGEGYDVTPVPSLEWSELSDHDILFLVYPLQRVDPGRLGAFVQAGGNVVIADDFGEAKDALAALGLLRAEVVTPHANKFQDGRVWAPIATARSAHPIADEVGDVVTNHPAALTQVQGATTVIGFDDGAVVVAGERGTGRFVAVSDPSIFINQMLQFPGNVQVTINMLRWLDRDHRAKHVVLLRGDTPMYGDPRPFIADPRGGQVGRGVADVNFWLSQRSEWLLTAGAMKGLAAALAALLLLLAIFALPVRPGPRVDGAWLRFGRPPRRDEPHAVVAAAERLALREPTASLAAAQLASRGRGAGSLMVLACVMRDLVQRALADAIGPAKPTPEPLYTLPEVELVALVSAARGTHAGVALARVYRRLRALPSRGQAAAPWSAGHLSRRDFDALYRDVGELCRTLGAGLAEAGTEAP